MNQAGKKHTDAQNKIVAILKQHYYSVRQEIPFPVPNPKYTYDPTVHPVLTYWFDVYAMQPKEECNVQYDKLGIEIDGDVGHKRTKAQFYRDINRTESLVVEYGFLVHRFDPEQVVGRGYRNPRTQQVTLPLTTYEVLHRLGINCKSR